MILYEHTRISDGSYYSIVRLGRSKSCNSDSRAMSDTTYSTDRISSVLTACIQPESGSSDNRRSPENARINRITVGSIRSDLIVVSSRISNPADRIRSPLNPLGSFLVPVRVNNGNYFDYYNDEDHYNVMAMRSDYYPILMVVRFVLHYCFHH